MCWTASTACIFYQRVAETSDTEASTASQGLSVTINSNGGSDGPGSSGGGGGSSSNDNSSTVIVTSLTTSNPDAPTQGEIMVSGTADSKGTVTINITNKAVTDAFDKALADAKKKITRKMASMLFFVWTPTAGLAPILLSICQIRYRKPSLRRKS